MNDPQVTSTEPALGISVQCAAGECQIVFQTHVAQTADKVALDALVDRLTAVAARQKAKVDLVDAEKNLATSERTLVQMRENRGRVEEALTAGPQEGRRNPSRHDQVKLQREREQADITEKQYEQNIRELRDIVAKHKAVIAGD